MSDEKAAVCRPSDLQRFGREVFGKLGMPEADAAVTMESLIGADLEGNESHGVSRMPIYAARMAEGRIAPRPRIKLERHGAILRVDGDRGLGQAVASRALQTAFPIAKETGIAGVFVRNSNHFGTAAFYCQQACRENMALIAMTNSPPGIPPWGGRKPFFGTNPIAFGFPVREGPPVIVDMSSSVVARGKIILAGKLGRDIPPGWAIDEQGAPTTDPAAALRGAILPVGGAKGYALAMAVELMCGLLTGAAFGPHVNNLYEEQDGAADVGHCFIVLHIGGWMPIERYLTGMEELLRELKDVPPVDGAEPIAYPGERRADRHRRREAEGLAIPPEVVRELTALGDKLGVAFPQGGDGA